MTAVVWLLLAAVVVVVAAVAVVFAVVTGNITLGVIAAGVVAIIGWLLIRLDRRS